MKIREYIQVKPAGGAPPDPATYCPANGYIPNPILPEDGWFLITQFQTNNPAGTTFDPVISATGQYAWDLGDGTIIMNDFSISHTYTDSSTKTVKLYGKGTCNIVQINCDSDNIIGNLDLSHSAFQTCNTYIFNTNSGITGVQFPATVTAALSQLYFNACNIAGSVDLSMFSKLLLSSTISFESNPNLTGFTFASSITEGNIGTLAFSSSGITGNLDLSVFNALSTSASIAFNNCPNLTGVTFASSITAGLLYKIWGYSCGLTGTLDLSMFTQWTTGADIRLYSNSNLTGVTFASSITAGNFGVISLYSTGITGNLNLSMFNAFSTNAQIVIYSNPNLTGITFASSISGTILSLSIYSNNNLTGVLDLSKFTSFTSTASISIYSNPNLTGITFASSITGTFGTISIYSNGLTGTLNLSKFTSFTATATVNVYSNTALSGVTFPAATITGFIRTLRMSGNTSMGYVDVTKLRTGVASLNWRFDGNGWTAAIVNQVLVNIDGISVSGFTSRIVNVGGTNADPDTTSGGYNGTAARTSLQGKSFTVTIT